MVVTHKQASQIKVLGCLAIFDLTGHYSSFASIYTQEYLGIDINIKILAGEGGDRVSKREERGRIMQCREIYFIVAWKMEINYLPK